MNPWTIIGWVFLSLLAVLGALLVYASVWMFFLWARRYLKYLKTRNNAIAVGQVWSGPLHQYYVEQALDDGKFSLKSGTASWGESPDEWKKRVRKERLRRVR